MKNGLKYPYYEGFVVFTVPQFRNHPCTLLILSLLLLTLIFFVNALTLLDIIYITVMGNYGSAYFLSLYFGIVSKYVFSKDIYVI